MLGKLSKYEIKATARMFLPLYIGLLLFSIINKVFLELNLLQTKFAFLPAISGMIYFFIVAAIFIITLIVMIQRFYKNLLCDEGYLMFTLPVKPRSLILSKMLISVLWVIVGIATAVLSVLVLSYQQGMFKELPEFVKSVFSAPFHKSGPLILTGILCIVTFLMYVISFVLQIYASLSLGHLFGKHRILLAFVAYLVISTFWQVIVSVGMVTVFSIKPLIKWINALQPQPLQMIQLMLAGVIVFCVVQSVVHYVITNIVLSKKLNLE